VTALHFLPLVACFVIAGAGFACIAACVLSSRLSREEELAAQAWELSEAIDRAEKRNVRNVREPGKWR
jgi:hypothetical protein